MRRCDTCQEKYPSHEVLDGRCPECRRILSETMTKNEVDVIWEEAEAFYSAPAEDFLDVT